MYMDGSRGGWGYGKSQVAIGFLRNTGTDPLEKQLYPRVLLEEGLYGAL